jgi:hypothetical protein
MLKLVLAFVAAACFSIWGLAYYQDHHTTYSYPFTGPQQPDAHPETEEQTNCSFEGAYTGAPLKERAEHHREFVAGCKAWLVANGRPNENPERNPWPAEPKKTFHQRVVDYCVGQMRPVNYPQEIFQLQMADPETQAEEVANRQKLRILESQFQHAVQSESDCEGYLLNGWTALPGEGEAPATKVFRQQALYDIKMQAGGK